MTPTTSTALGTAAGTDAGAGPGSVLARFESVTRRYGDITAVSDVTLDIGPGRIVGLLGPNGAGKSTLISLLQGLRRPTSGTVTLFGRNPQDARARLRLGSTPQETALPDALKVGEVVDYVGSHFADARPRSEALETFGLAEFAGRQIGSLSGGQKRRLGVALAFVGNPRLVLLDEPTTGLDVDARRRLWESLRAQHELGATIVVTSHYLEEIEALAERVVVMGEGRVLADDTLPNILARVGLQRVELSATGSAAAKIAVLPGVVRAESPEAGDRTVFFTSDSDEFIRGLVRSGLPFSGLAVRGASLEEAFLSLTGPGGQGRPAHLVTEGN